MQFSIQRKLNPVFETMILLHNGYDLAKFKEIVLKQAMDAGADGEKVYQRTFHVFEKYAEQFQKNRVVSDKDPFFFQDTSFDFYNSLTSLFIADNELIYTIDQLDHHQIMERVFRYSEEIFDVQLPDYSEQALADFMKPDQLSGFINSMELGENEKWKLYLILQNPKEYLSQYARIVRDNIPAYESAAKAVKASLDKYLKRYDTVFTDEEKVLKYLAEHNISNFDVNRIIPTMAFSSGILITMQTCIYGLNTDEIFDMFGLDNSKSEYLLTCLKALSDKSKFDILTTLKSSPKYATELASGLGLTSATVSHHMGTLLAARLVYVQKENGKYYYHVDETSVNTIIEQLRQLLL